ncbi:DUF2254 domain-containing protein [Gordonia sp. NPDC003585]|uniref:DUF2254 domain-containing protein n=1 Tax=Gordonia sp. NPDC003585 TaxID=3154275 RepID=UPI0033A97C5C
MAEWFARDIVDNGRLPLFFLLIAFVLTFLFIRLSVRMIRAEVSWWPGNVTPGGLHMHHEFFGVMLMLISGFSFVVLSNFHTPVADCVLAVVFGIGSALVLDEFALLLHLRDVYWEEEGRASVDAVFVAIAFVLLFLVGFRPVGFADVADVQNAPTVGEKIAVIVLVAIVGLLAIITLFKGKLWTGFLGLFISPLLIVGAIRVARPQSPWARWRYVDHPGKMAKSRARERRYRQPLIRWKVVVQEALAGRFGIPEAPAEPVVVPPNPQHPRRAPNRVASAIRWRRTRRHLERRPPWRLPVTMVSVSIVVAVIAALVDDDLELRELDVGTTATLLGVIAGAMATLTGLVFTAVTLAMQFGASQISVRVIPMFQQDPVMRWSIGVFLSTFAFTLIIALDLATGAEGGPGISTGVALGMTLLSVYMFIILIGKVGSILNSSQLLRWVETEGRGAIRRLYPDEMPVDMERTVARIGSDDDRVTDTEPGMIVTLRDIPTRGRVLLAIDLARIQRLAIRWDVQVDLLIGIGDFVPNNAGVFEVFGDRRRVHPHQLLTCLLFGDTHLPEVSPAAALQAITDVALKALSPAINDPSRAVQALDHIENLLLMLAPRVFADQQSGSLSMIRGYRRSWADCVAIGTDQIRQYGAGSAQVERRLRALFENLIAQCPDVQDAPLIERLQALDEQVEREWPTSLDRRLASEADVQGFGSESGRTRGRRLSINRPKPDPLE